MWLSLSIEFDLEKCRLSADDKKMLEYSLVPSHDHPAFCKPNICKMQEEKTTGNTPSVQMSRRWASLALNPFDFTFWFKDCNNLWSSKLPHAKSYDCRFCNCDILACTQLQNWSKFLLKKEGRKRTLQVIHNSKYLIPLYDSSWKSFLLPPESEIKMTQLCWA